ncbi:hypothetical protein EN978_29665 [Mesorhizobium sp. M7A.F.Ca.US.001.04.1.1]|uniref:hypothetical protein n=1 Tax=unclassified Mesorhizobium TaxID=325217 RepID=UPI000FC9F1A0|nr:MULTISPECIES: hypothetical protein [unclassified Mesorhizobium]RUY24632.1 hypothetical protein EN979_25435 [Mesorhizobium sp. M7A.F.Ca.US.001.04.2.1]RUY36399.1 hypothetical protein EN978_29665 [Mesorhizobium sp. M7A.F.Ca.US.001.04.1.1]
MTTQVVHRVFGPKQVRQFWEVYERARVVEATYPDSHIASKAAKRLIEAFEAEIQTDGTVLDFQQLCEANPLGTA